MEIKSAKEIINQKLYITDDGEPNSVHDSIESVVEAMQEYAKQFIDLAAEEVTCDCRIDYVNDYDYSAGHNGMTGGIDKESILEIKQLIK